MAWLASQPRLTQVYVQTVAWLNDCRIRPNGAELKPWLREELAYVAPPVTSVEAGVVLVGMVVEKVKFEGTPESKQLFEEHPMFKGNTLGKIC